MVHYTKTPEVNKRMVAGYYLFLCLVGFAILLGPTGSGIPITLVGDEGRYEHDLSSPDNSSYTDPAQCAVCHSDQHGNWTNTGHADAAHHINDTGVGFVGIGAYVVMNYTRFNSSCYECHSTDVDGDGNWDILGVTCFSCHNMTSPWVEYSGEGCGDCHSGDVDGDHPYQYAFWENSVHANSLTDLRGSTHAASYCMHCQATEAFIHQQNPGMLADTNPNVNTSFPVDGDYNSISCPACHAVHANWSSSSPAMIRAVNATELCGLCHVGSHHPHYEVWIGGSHHLAGVECIDCHGYDLTIESGNPFLNHSFVVDPEIACGQEDCHDGVGGSDAVWALGQLQMTEDSFVALTEEIIDEAESLQAIVDAYALEAGANTTLVDEITAIIGDVEDVVHYYQYDGSSGFHDRADIFASLNEAYADLLNGKATFYEWTGFDTVTVTEIVTETVTETVTVTVTVPGGGYDTLTLVGGASGGIVLGLVLGVLVGRRR